MSWWPFPPATQEVQMDEKWAFVYKKQKHCDPDHPADHRRGDNWDHVAYDSEHRLVLSTVPGKRSAKKVTVLVNDTHRRLGRRLPRLITTDEYAPYKQAILDAFGQTITPPRTGKPGRPKAPYKIVGPDLTYATVHKKRKNGRVVDITFNVVFGTPDAVASALAASAVSKQINTAFIERQNGTDRNRNSRKARKTYGLSKDWDIHEAVGYFTLYSYNFCWPVRTLSQKDNHGRPQTRTPAMAAALTDHVWTLDEWLSLPAIRHTH